jgi:iron complex outermembrane receptor protein
VPALPPSGASYLASNTTQIQSAYHVVNLNLDVDYGRWIYSFYVNNVTDESPILDFNRVSGLSLADTLRPRTIGMNLRARM